MPQLGVALDLLPFLQETGERLTIPAHTKQEDTEPSAGSSGSAKNQTKSLFRCGGISDHNGGVTKRPKTKQPLGQLSVQE